MAKKDMAGAAGGSLPPATHTLPSGRIVQWQMPDVLSVISFSGTLPDPVTAAVIKLLLAEGSYTPEDDPRSWHHKVEQVRGMYGIVAAGLIAPKLDAAKEWGDGNGTLGRRDLPWMDVVYIHNVLFRVGADTAIEGTARAADAGGAALSAPASDDVPSDAGGASGAN